MLAGKMLSQLDGRSLVVFLGFVSLFGIVAGFVAGVCYLIKLSLQVIASCSAEALRLYSVEPSGVQLLLFAFLVAGGFWILARLYVFSLRQVAYIKSGGNI